MGLLMTAQQFTAWLSAMQAGGLARSDAACGRLLGITPRHVLRLKRGGGSKMLSLACWALLNKRNNPEFVWLDEAHDITKEQWESLPGLAIRIRASK